MATITPTMIEFFTSESLFFYLLLGQAGLSFRMLLRLGKRNPNWLDFREFGAWTIFVMSFNLLIVKSDTLVILRHPPVAMVLGLFCYEVWKALEKVADRFLGPVIVTVLMVLARGSRIAVQGVLEAYDQIQKQKKDKESTKEGEITTTITTSEVELDFAELFKLWNEQEKEKQRQGKQLPIPIPTPKKEKEKRLSAPRQPVQPQIENQASVDANAGAGAGANNAQQSLQSNNQDSDGNATNNNNNTNKEKEQQPQV